MLESEQYGWRGTATTLALRDGLGLRIGLDENTARLVAALRPDQPLRAACDAVAADVGADVDIVEQVGCELVRKLLELGFFEPRS